LTGAYREDLNWLVTDFTTRVADIAHAIVVSADGVPLALSAGIPPMAVEQFSAITSGLTSLVVGAARIMEAGVPLQALIEMEHGLMFVKAISDGSSLAVLAAPECDTRQVSYEMTRLVEAVGELLTPAIRAEVLAEVYRGAGVTLRPRASSFGNLITRRAIRQRRSRKPSAGRGGGERTRRPQPQHPRARPAAHHAVGGAAHRGQGDRRQVPRTAPTAQDHLPAGVAGRPAGRRRPDPQLSIPA